MAITFDCTYKTAIIPTNSAHVANSRPVGDAAITNGRR